MIMKPAVLRSLGVAITLFAAACGAEGSDGASPAESDSADSDSADSDPSEAARAAGLHIEEFDGVHFFWEAPDGYHEALLLPARPAIENGCLVVGRHVIVWHSTDVTVARSLITALRAGDAVDEMSLGGGEAPLFSPFVGAIRERCGTEAVWGAGPLDD
jgi:hypothetical protein